MPSTPSLRRNLEKLLWGSYSPAQLHELLQHLFGQCLAERLPSHEHVAARDYFFNVVENLDDDGYLVHKRLGRRLFVELMVQRPGYKDELHLLAEVLGLDVMQEYETRLGPQNELDSTSRLSQLTNNLGVGARHSRQVRLNINIANGFATASWWLGEDEIKESAPLAADTSHLHEAQRRLIEVTRRGGSQKEIGEASSALGTLLSQHIFGAGIRTQFILALDKINRGGGELNVQLEFGGGEDLAQLSWELLRDPSEPHSFLSTMPGVFLTRRYPRTTPRYRPPDTPKKLLLVLGAKEGEEEANKVRQLWTDKGLPVRLVEKPGRYELMKALNEGPWDVMHLIAHGHPELVLLKDTLYASQLANMTRGNVRSGVVLSVCTGASANIPTDSALVDAYDRGSLAWRGVAPALIGAGLSNVLAWTNLAYVDECAHISPEWHQKYLSTGDPREATRAARSLLRCGPECSFGWLAHFTG